MDDAKTKEERIAAAAERALAEAEARRRAEAEEARRRAGAGDTLPKELGGRNGPEPTRFGDWEKDGIISDF